MKNEKAELRARRRINSIFSFNIFEKGFGNIELERLSTNRFDPQYKIRREEIKLVMDDLFIQRKSKVLEIGCGSGLQSTFLSEKTDFLVCSDITFENLAFKKLCLVRCAAENLPFKKDSFNIVYSSNVLEHVKDRRLTLKEMKRVLEKDGILVCSVPTSFWKILQLLLDYPKKLCSFVKWSKKQKRNQQVQHGYQGMVSTLSKWWKLSVHGEFECNREEFVAYMLKRWLHLFQVNGFHVFKVKKLLLYAPLKPFGLRAKNITILPGWLKLEKITGLCSCMAFFATLISDSP